MSLTSNDIVIGSGELFAVEITQSTTIPTTDAAWVALCVEANRLSHIKNGATLSYAATYYDAKDDMQMVQKTIATEENVTFKSGLMTWNPEVIQKIISTANAFDDGTTGTTDKGIEIGGLQNYKNTKYLVIFKQMDGESYVAFVGQSRTSFDMAFVPGQESVLDLELSCLPELTNDDAKKYCVRYFKYKTTT